jgi:pSer/pThr/pTyr-binding forkhead associated (FHA) protein
MAIPPDQIEQETLVTKPSPPAGPELTSGAVLGVRVLTSGDIVSLIGRDNFTLGRSTPGQAVVPDVDLSLYEAYDHGISRMHAELQIQTAGVFIVDLDSANGTLVNGKKIPPQSPQAVHHGDMIQLGRMRLQIISHHK